MIHARTSSRPPRDLTGIAGLVAFFGLAYALSWVFWIPAGLLETGRLDLPVPTFLLELLGGLGPMAAAMILAGIQGGAKGVRALFRQVLRFRVGAEWYLLVFFGLPLLGLPDLLLHVAAGHPLDARDLVPLLILVPFHFTFVALVGGGLDEELGWRGFALPELQRRFHPLTANLLLGVLWSCWHLPLWFIPGTFQSAQSFPLYLVGVTAASILLGWIYNGTGGSLLLVILAHSAMDATDNVRSNLLGAITQEQAGEYHLVRTALEVGVGILIVALTRTRLGTERSERATGGRGSDRSEPVPRSHDLP